MHAQGALLTQVIACQAHSDMLCALLEIAFMIDKQLWHEVTEALDGYQVCQQPLRSHCRVTIHTTATLG